MLDGFARSITYLRISITDRCNYRCRYCMPEEGVEKRAHGDFCSLEELRDMAAAAVRCGVKKKFPALKSSASRRMAACSKRLPGRCATRASRTSTSASTR